ncbi:MAG: chemotaxis protein CheD [Deltaproteobacteria bacterium]|nr:chemotaxis protein CheD [Deltaproteobacteria bacterium]
MKLPKELLHKLDANGEPVKKVKILPGEYYASSEDVIITTLLGSCVAACLYDPVHKVIGMNHFLLSNDRYSREMPACKSEAGRYGVYAMEMLVNDMLKRGASRRNMQAKAFGGATQLNINSSRGNDVFTCVGEVNCRFVREYLSRENIPLVVEDLGGAQGRVVHFCFSDFTIFSRKIEKTFTASLVKRDKAFWKKSVEKQQNAVSDNDIWL